MSADKPFSSFIFLCGSYYNLNNKMYYLGVPVVAQQGKNLTSNLEDVGSIPGLTQWVKGSGIVMSYGVRLRLGLDPALLWCRLAAAALIPPLAWELPYAMSAALKGQTRQNKKQKNSQKNKQETHV